MPGKFLQNLTVDERAELLGNGKLQSRAAGDLLVTAGSRPGAISVILSGTAEVRSDKGTLATLAAGDVFGEMSYVRGADSVATANVHATSPVELVVLDDTTLDKLINNRPQTAARLFRSLAMVLAQRLYVMSQRAQPAPAAAAPASRPAPDVAPAPRPQFAPKAPWTRQEQ